MCNYVTVLCWQWLGRRCLTCINQHSVLFMLYLYHSVYLAWYAIQQSFFLIHWSMKKSVQSVDSSFECNEVGEAGKFLSKPWYLNQRGDNGNVIFGPWLWILQLLPWVLDRSIQEALQRKLGILSRTNHVNFDAPLKNCSQFWATSIIQSNHVWFPMHSIKDCSLSKVLPMLDQVYRWMHGINNRHR
jgi:hypothetical protein